MRRVKHKGVRRFRSSTLFWCAISLIAIAITISVAILFFGQPAGAPTSKQAGETVNSAQPKSEGISSNVQFLGDVFWGRLVQRRAEASSLGYKYITSGLTRSDRGKYDAWIANFECPVTTRDVPYDLQVDILKFNCRPEYLPNLANWFTAASLANNHTANNGGQWGIDQTRDNLGRAGIQYFGNYSNDPDDICEVITVPAKTSRSHRTTSMPIAMCGFMYVVDQAPTAEQLSVMEKYALVMPVIAFPHMGVEYRPTAEAQKVAAYKAMIDHGADAVIGGHPHVIQNSEVYKGRLIAYSLGNFLFDQQSLGRAETLGLGVGIKLTIDDGDAAKIYEKVAPSCQAFKDDCLKTLQAELKTRPTINVSYSFTCYDESSKVPKLCDQAAVGEAFKAATISDLSTLAYTWE